MIKTKKMACIAQQNPRTCKYARIERRVYEDENGDYFVRINGEFFSIDYLAEHGRKVFISEW